jgi:hypothetical protein
MEMLSKHLGLNKIIKRKYMGNKNGCGRIERKLANEDIKMRTIIPLTNHILSAF